MVQTKRLVLLLIDLNSTHLQTVYHLSMYIYQLTFSIFHSSSYFWWAGYNLLSIWCHGLGSVYFYEDYFSGGMPV